MFFAGRLTTATLTAGGASAESFDFPLSSSTGYSILISLGRSWRLQYSVF